MSLIDNPKFCYITLFKAGEAAPVIETTTALEGRATNSVTVTGGAERGTHLWEVRRGDSLPSLPVHVAIIQNKKRNHSVHDNILLTK